MVAVFILLAAFIGLWFSVLNQAHGYLSTLTEVFFSAQTTLIMVLNSMPSTVAAFLYFLVTLGIIALIIKIFPFLG